MRTKRVLKNIRILTWYNRVFSAFGTTFHILTCCYPRRLGASHFFFLLFLILGKKNSLILLLRSTFGRTKSSNELSFEDAECLWAGSCTSNEVDVDFSLRTKKDSLCVHLQKIVPEKFFLLRFMLLLAKWTVTAATLCCKYFRKLCGSCPYLKDDSNRILFSKLSLISFLQHCGWQQNTSC